MPGQFLFLRDAVPLAGRPYDSDYLGGLLVFIAIVGSLLILFAAGAVVKLTTLGRAGKSLAVAYSLLMAAALLASAKPIPTNYLVENTAVNPPPFFTSGGTAVITLLLLLALFSRPRIIGNEPTA